MTASLDKEIKHYLPFLENEEKQSILGVIKSFMKLKESPGQRISIEQYNKEIDEAEKRYDAGFFTSHEDVLKESESW
jgi:hypothetical protein